jgi:acyl dehydratase
MPINPDAVGATGEGERSWTSKDALLYAVGVGAGADDPLKELQFTTENSKDIQQQVLPTMAVILGAGGGGAMRSVGTFNPAMLLHGEQEITLHQPIPVEGSLKTTSTLTGVYDKGSGAVLETTSESVDAATGKPLFSTRSQAFIRGEGGFGGERGPSGNPNAAPERKPDIVVSAQTRPDQALTYRLSGDRNPLHSDPAFAAAGGFDRPILHGLCTYGFTGRLLLNALCDGDPAKFGGMVGRFKKPVLPGEELTVSIWKDDTGAIFQTSTVQGVVIDGGRVTVR